MFDQGWDKLREETFARQKELGVIPADAELTPRDPAFPAWDDVPDNLRAFYARQMEVYSGYSENADYNVGRVIDAIEDLGELDDTLIVWIWGDNGASMEGTITGSFNELTTQNGIPLTQEMQLQLSEQYGGLDQWGAADHGSALLGRVGVGRGHAVSVGQAGGFPPWRDPQSNGRAVAGPHQGRRCPAHTIHSRHRRGSYHSRRCRAYPSPQQSMASSKNRCTAPRSARRSATAERPNTARSNISRRWATAPCTRTAGGWP